MSSATNFISANLDHVRQHVDQVKYHVVPTLADIGQLVWDDLDDNDEPISRGGFYNNDEEGEGDEDEEDLEIEEETKKQSNVSCSCCLFLIYFLMVIIF